MTHSSPQCDTCVTTGGGGASFELLFIRLEPVFSDKNPNQVALALSAEDLPNFQYLITVVAKKKLGCPVPLLSLPKPWYAESMGVVVCDDAELWGGSRFQIPCLLEQNRKDSKEFCPREGVQTSNSPNFSSNSCVSPPHTLTCRRCVTGFTVRAVGNPQEIRFHLNSRLRLLV